MDASKKKQFLKIKEKNINRWTFHKKKILFNKIVEHSIKRYHSMDCKKKEKHLNTKKSIISNSSTEQKIFKT